MGSVGLALSVGLLVVFAAFIAFNVVSARRSAAEHRDEIAVEQALAQGDENAVVQAALELGDDPAAPARPDRRTVLVNGAKFVVGAVGIVVGAQLLVDNGSALARLAGVSEHIIGVTIIAVGTSLPELVTTVTAIVKKRSALSAGNIIGANVIDLTFILPLCALVSGRALPIELGPRRPAGMPACGPYRRGASTGEGAPVPLAGCAAPGRIRAVPGPHLRRGGGVGTRRKGGRRHRWQRTALSALHP